MLESKKFLAINILLYFIYLIYRMNYKLKNIKICICFFGLTRSLKYTYSYMNDNLFKVLENNNIEYDIYLHSYNLEILTNKRSNEFNEKLDINEFKMLNPKEYIIDNQDQFDKSFNYESVKKYGDRFKDKFASVYNLIRQLNSLKKVTSIIKKYSKYDMYIYIRPDLKFKYPFDIDYIYNNIDNKFNYILTPFWGKNSGLNDKFAIGNYNSIIKYGERINDIYNYMEKFGSLHSESLVQFISKKYNITNIDINVVLLRIRSNGLVAPRDMKKINNIPDNNKNINNQ